ncbi:PREDICTED: THO complex subunit 2 isoform X4 [Cyphomyrmex costatus]|uniref:THO complex subunit 2 isoform X4 n=1 Tax=Cyphomyrmex costatus TaxID=456900 RepID=UPI000852336B|nr:PREDICTED: THO complex subunit 2 isoform X4 [Cyphomyrmex costatus]XP_018404814.1 PREDICTED: THO complex subunit 2 isoform X4 [Cyphomyrmex costatus]
MASKIWHTELWKSWDKHGKNDFLKLIKHKFKEGNIPEWRRGLYELISNGIHGNVKKDNVIQTLGELTSFDGAIPSAIVDIFTLIDAETHNEERNNFYYIVKESEKFLTDRILKERLEIETLQDVGTLKNKNFQTKFIKVKTKLYYKQRKFNLFREESEGYSKLIVELNQERPDSEVASTLEIVKSLIGYFNLDPNRVLDILLETFENRPQDDTLFIPLIRSYMSDQQVLCEVLGFKYCSTINATPFSLQKVTALMLQHGVIKLDDILPWLVPDDKTIISDHEQVMKQAKEYVRKMSVISTKDKEDVIEEKESAQDKYASNQKFGLCEALLEVGAWEVAQSLFNRLPDYCFTDQRPIALALCKMIQALVEPVYRKHCIVSPKLPGRKVSPLKSSLSPPSLCNLEDIHDYLLPMLIVLGPNLHHDPILMYKVMRLCHSAIKHCPLDGSKQPLNKDCSLYYDVLTILDVALLPSLSFMDCNCCVAEELWNILKYYPYQNRYCLYARWKNDTLLQHAALLRKRADAQKKIKSIMKRVSKETIKPVGRSIGKLTHSSPGVLFDYVLIQIQLYDNLIGPVVDSLKYLTNISYDVLGYCLVEALAGADRDRFKHDGTSISLWLQSLASFCGAIFKKYNIELTGLLQYVANQLKAQKSLDLLILKEIVQKMAGIEAAEEMTSDQLDAMAGGDLLKNEAGYFSQVRNTKKSSQRLKETLAEQDLAVALCLLMAQQKHCVVYRETDKSHLKLVGKLYDQCQDTLVQFGTFLGSTMTVDEYVERLPSIHSMLQDNHIHADVAFFLARPMFAHAINIKYDALRKADPNYKKMSTSMKQLKYAEAAQAVMAPVAQSVRPLHPLKVWEDISPQFLVTFWSLSMYDLYVPMESYQREISKLKQLAVQTVDSKDMNVSKGKKEQERYTTLIEKLQDEKKKQEEHVEKVFAYLRQEKDTWFLSRSAKSAKNETITQFLQLCLFPRCTFTTVDAMYCAKFVHTIHSLKTANFSTLLCYDRLFCDITYSVTSCTENEANRYGRFLCAMLETVMRWHSEKTIFDKECSNYPGFVTKFRVSNQFSEANDMVGFENYRHVCHKWHYKITKAIVVCLDSKDYVQIRNSLIILIKILPHFPVLAKLSQILERKVEKVREEERGQRQDLHVLATSYSGQLKAKTPSMIRESDFHHVGDKAAKTQDATNNEPSEKVSNGVTVKENNNGDTRPGKENKEQREKRSSSSQTHHSETSEKFRKKEDSKDISEIKEKYVKKDEIKDDEGLDKKDRKYYKEEHYYSSSVDNLDRDLSSVSNSSASSGPIQEGPERVSDVKRRKIESAQKQEARRADAVLEKKERSSKGKARDEQKELRREKKQGRKRDRTEESIATTEQKRRKDDERAKNMHQNGDIPEHREKHHYSKLIKMSTSSTLKGRNGRQ